MNASIEDIIKSNKQFLTPDDVSPLVGVSAQKIREKAYCGQDLGFEYRCEECGKGQRKPRVKIPRESFLKYYTSVHKQDIDANSALSKKKECALRHASENEVLEMTYFTVDDVSNMLKVSRDTVYAWIASGQIVSYKIGKQYRISSCALNEFIIGHQTAA